MRKNKWQRLLSCWTLMMIFLSIFWISILRMRYQQSEYRVELLGLMEEQTSAQFHLAPVLTPFKTQLYQLSQILTEDHLQTVNHHPILVITSSESDDYLNIMSRLYLPNQTPLYLISRISYQPYQTFSQIQHHLQELSAITIFFTTNFPSKKLTILAFQQSSIFLLRVLATIQPEYYPLFETIFMFNVFNPQITFYFSSSQSFIEETKALILMNAEKIKFFNNTKFIIINTLNNNVGFNRKLNWLIQNENQESLSFSNTVVVSSKFMWNVYSYLKYEEYCRFQPFVQNVAASISKSIEKPLNHKDIEYMLLFNEQVDVQYFSQKDRQKFMGICGDLYLEKNMFDGVTFRRQCVRVLKKQDFYFNDDAAIIINAKGQFQIFGEYFEKLSPMSVRPQEYIYLIENVQNIKRFLIINRNKVNIRFTVVSKQIPQVYQPIQLLSPSHDLEYRHFIYGNMSRRQIIRECPGFSLIYPTHYGPKNHLDKRLYLDLMEDSTSYCYIASDFLILWVQEIVENWPLWYNLAIFTLFCTHILEKSVFSRFYIQFFVNKFITYITVGQFFPLQNGLLITIMVVIELFLQLNIWLSNSINTPKHIMSRLMWLPLTFQIMRSTQQFHEIAYPSPWKIVGLQLLLLLHEKNIYILLIQALYLMKYIRNDKENLIGIVLVCLWIIITNPKKPEDKKKSIMSKIIDNLALIVIVMFMGEDGLYLHYITQVYMGINIVFNLAKIFDCSE